MPESFIAYSCISEHSKYLNFFSPQKLTIFYRTRVLPPPLSLADMSTKNVSFLDGSPKKTAVLKEGRMTETQKAMLEAKIMQVGEYTDS